MRDAVDAREVLGLVYKQKFVNTTAVWDEHFTRLVGHWCCYCYY